MNTRFIFSSLILLLGLWGFSGCSNDESGPDVLTDGNLLLSYEVLGADKVATYALAATADECKINNMYTLFFRASNHGTAPNRYVGYTRSGVAASGTGAAGTSRVTLPTGEDVNDEWQLLFVANLDEYANLNGEADVDTWLTNELGGLVLNTAKPKLTAFFNQTAGMKSPLLMSGEMSGAGSKPSGTNVATITLQRAVARVDVANTAVNFQLETVELWNARTMAYAVDNVGNMSGTTANDFVHYNGNTVTTTSGRVEAKLYAYPNIVMVPAKGDKHTTCLIIGGKWNNNATSYYRVNVCPKGGSQNMKRNGAYTININNVTADGQWNKDDAFNNDDAMMTYTINEWDDSFNGTYIFDKDGNGLAISQRNVTFSEKGGQDIEIEIMQIQSSTASLATNTWTVAGLSGVHAAEFTATKLGATKVKVSTLSENAGATDREAIAKIQWGTIAVPINLVQLSPLSQMKGIKVTPSSLWFPLIPTAPKEVCINLQGNFSGVTRADIQTSIIYAAGATGWLTLAAGTTPDAPAAGLFYYRVTATNLAGDIRDADIKFVITKGAQIMTAQVDVRQTTVDLGSGYIRQLAVYMLEKSGASYINRGLIADRYTKFKGLPAGQSGSNHLHFPIVERLAFKYKMEITSSMGWKIVAPGSASVGLNFSKTSDPGDLVNTKEVEVTAVSDAASGWDGTFYIEYDNGDRTAFVVHQHGVLATLDAHTIGSGTTVLDGNIYYYGTFRMNNKLWLDRNIGATSNGYFSNQPSTGIPNDLNAKGLYLAAAQAIVSCPTGFRLPKNDDGEWDWVAANVIWSTALGNAGAGGLSYKYIHYISYSYDPTLRWMIPIAGLASTPTHTVGFYWVGNGASMHNAFQAPNGIVNYAVIGTGNSFSVRCVQR